jgi:hypothetical protein
MKVSRNREVRVAIQSSNGARRLEPETPKKASAVGRVSTRVKYLV